MIDAIRKPPVVLFLLSTLTIGGSEVKTVRLANELWRRKRRVVLAYLNAPHTLLSELNPDIPVRHFGRRGRFSVSAVRQLMRFMEEQSVDAVVCINLYPALYAKVAHAFVRTPRARIVVSVNTSNFRTMKERLEMVLIYRKILLTVDQIIFGAEAQRQQWGDRYGVGLGNQSIVLHNGVDTEYFDKTRVPALASHLLPDVKHIVGTVGKLRPEKGHISFVEAIAKLRQLGVDAGAIIVGDGPERARIEATIRQLSLEPFVLIADETKDVRPYLASMDLFVLASITVETFSNAALEAMAMGCPIISTRIGGMPEMLKYGGGRLVEVGDVNALTQALREVIANEPERLILATSARRVASEYFSWGRMVSRFEATVMDCGHCQPT